MTQKNQHYGEQAVYLSDTKVDLMWLERFSNLEELLLALRAIRQVSLVQTVAHLSFEPDRTSQEKIEELKHLMNSGATFVGVTIQSIESLKYGLIQELIDEVGVLSLILDFDLDQNQPPDIMKIFLRNIPSETAMICGGQSFLPEQIFNLSNLQNLHEEDE